MEKKEHSCTVGRNKNWYSHCSRMFLKKLEVELSHDPATLLLGIHPKKMKTLIQKRYMYFHFHCSIIYNSENMQITCVQHTHRSNIIQPFVTTWMDLAGIMLNEISQTKKDKYCIISFMCGIRQTNRVDTEDRLVVSRGTGLGWTKRVERVQRYKLLSYKINVICI